MKQERRNAAGAERDLDAREPAKEGVSPREPGVEEPVRRFDGEDSLRGKSDGEILQRYEF